MTSIPPVVPEGTRVTLASMPDDFHHHFRDGEVCADVLRHASVRFGRAIAMPNLKVSSPKFWVGFSSRRTRHLATRPRPAPPRLTS